MSSAGCWIRNCLYAGGLIMLAPWMLWRRFRTGRYRDGLRQKLWGPPRDLLNSITRDQAERSPVGPLIWLHGVSVGEVQLLKPLLDALHQQCPAARFALSTTTESGMRLARQLMPAEVALFYFPWDFSWAIQRTLRILKPSLIVLGELELWPNLIELAQRNGTPLTVVNGRLSERSFRAYTRFSSFTRAMFQRLSMVAAQTEEYAERFQRCGTSPSSVVVTGNVKFDNVLRDRRAPAIEALRALVGLSDLHRVFVAGSTQDPEEFVSWAAYRQVRVDFPELKFVVVPRHPDRFETVVQQLSAEGTRVVRRSGITRPLTADEWDVLVVDTVGELRYWWGVAELALVGGSFGTRGGQNMLEPAAFGCNVAFGPNTSNFRDVVEQLRTAEAAIELNSLEQVEAWLRAEMLAPQGGRLRGERAIRLIENGQGALARTTSLMIAQIDQRTCQLGSGQQRPGQPRSAA